MLFRQSERVDLDAVAEAAELRILDAVALESDVVPKLGEGPHLAHFRDEPDAGVDEEADASHDPGKALVRDLARVPDRIENGDGVGQREGDLLDRRRPCFLQVVGADIDRVPGGCFTDREKDRVRRQPERGPGRKNVGAARQVLLDDVVLDGPLERLAGHAAPVGKRDVEGEEPWRGGVDRHRRVHALEGDAVEQGFHVAEMGDGNTDPSDLAAGDRLVGVVARLGRQVEGHRQTCLPALQVRAVEPVGVPCRTVA